MLHFFFSRLLLRSSAAKYDTDEQWVVYRFGLLSQALLEAERTGQTWKQLGLLPAPHFHDKDGSVKVTWQYESTVLPVLALTCMCTLLSGTLLRIPWY